MSGEFTGSIGRDFLRSEARDRQTGRAIGLGGITYESARYGRLDGQQVYRRVRAVAKMSGKPDWMQAWQLGDAYFYANQFGGPRYVPKLVEEIGRPEGASLNGSVFNAIRVMDTPALQQWEIRSRSGAIVGTVDATWEDAVSIGEFFGDAYSAFLADTDYPGTVFQTTPSGVETRYIDRRVIYHQNVFAGGGYTLGRNTTGGTQHSTAMAYAFNVGEETFVGYAPFVLKGARIGDDVIVTPEDEPFLNSQGLMYLCGMVGVNPPALRFEFRKSSLGVGIAHRALFGDMTQINCIRDVSMPSGELRLGPEELTDFWSIRSNLDGINGGRNPAHFLTAIAGGTGNPAIDGMAITFGVSPSCF